MADYGIRLNADATGLVGGTEKSAAALKGVEDQAKKTGQAFAEMGRASRTAAEEQRRVAEELRSAIEAQNRAREADANRKFEASALAQQLQAQRQAQAALNVETERGAGSMRAATAEAIAMTAAKSGLRSAMSALMGLFTGPAGLISILAAGALSWTSFGNAAEDGTAKAEAAAAKARASAKAAAAPPSQLGALGEQVLSLQGLIARREEDLGRAGGEHNRAQIQAELDQLVAARNATVRAIAAYTPAQAAAPGMSIEDATEGLRTASSAAREYEERVGNINKAYAAQIGLVQQLGLDPGEKEGRILDLKDEREEALIAAQRRMDAQLKALQGPKAPRDREQSAVDSLVKQATEMLAVSAATEKLTAAETLRVKIVADMNAGLLNRQKVEASGLLVTLGAAEANQKDAASRLAAQKSLENYNKESAQAQAKMAAEATQQENASRKLQEHAQELGLTTEQLGRLKVKRAEEVVALEEHRVALSRMPEAIEGELAANERRLESARRALDAAREIGAKSVAAEQAKAADREWKRASDNIERSLTDALMRGFDKGKTFGENLRDSLVNMFKTLVLEPIIRPIAQAGASALLGAFGMPGSAGAAGGGFGGAGNLFSLGNNLFGGGGMGFGGALEFGSGFASTAFASSAASAAMIEAGTVGFAGAGMEAGALGMGATGALGAAIPWVGAALLAANALGLFDEGGGPKPSELGILGSPGGFYVSQNNVPGGAANLPLYNTLNSVLNDPTKYDPAKLAGLTGYMSGGPGESAESMFQKVLQRLAPAAQAAAQAVAEQTSATEAEAKRLASVNAQRHQMDLTILDLEGRAVEALAARRRDELDAMDESLRAEAWHIYELQDLATAQEAAAESAREQADAQRTLMDVEGGLRSAVLGLPGQLGITSLEAARMSLATSADVAPLDRFAAARGYLTEGYGRAIGGDLSAVQAFPQLVQSALAIGRDVFASGPQFAELFAKSDEMLKDLIVKQNTIQNEITAEVPMAIKEASADQVGELRRGFKAIVDKLDSVESQLRQLSP